MNAIAQKHEAEMLPADPMVSMIERVAMDPQADISKLERMLEMKERMDAQRARAEHAAAFAKASADFPPIPMNGDGHNGKKYALLKDILSKTRPALSENGLALNFDINITDTVCVTARLSHVSGHVETVSIDLPRDSSGSKNAVQSVGSSQTYGQRYTAQAILGLSLGDDTEDDGRSTGSIEQDAPRKQYSWAETVTADLPENATPREKAEAIASALCAQFRRMKGSRQIDNEWDRRATIIGGLEEKHPDLWGNVIEAYETRRQEIDDKAAEERSGMGG